MVYLRVQYELLLLLFFDVYCAACGILVCQPGIKLMSIALGAWSPNHWTSREVPEFLFLIQKSQDKIPVLTYLLTLSIKCWLMQ